MTRPRHIQHKDSTPAPAPPLSPEDISLLKSARVRRGSLRAIEQRTGIPYRTIQGMTTEGTGLSTARSWWRLLRYLGIDPDVFLGPDPDTPERDSSAVDGSPPE